MRTIRRLAILAGTALTISAVTWALVDAFASAPVRRRRATQWADPIWSDMAQRVGGELLIVAGVAVAGRKLLRLKL